MARVLPRHLWLAVIGLICVGLAGESAEVTPQDSERLPRSQYRSGEQVLRALTPLSESCRSSVVKLDIDGATVCLGAVVDKSGLIVTKASELRPGRLSAWLSTGKEVPAKLLGVDAENDVALVKVESDKLKPVEWGMNRVEVGQWVVTQGIAATPQALGVVSVPARKIRHPRALIGVSLAMNGSSTTIASVMEGLGAEAAGLRGGDQVKRVDGIPVTEGQELIKRLRDYREGQTVTLGIRRDDHELEVIVTLKRAGGETEDRTDRIDRMGGDASGRAEGFELALQHDSVLQPWQCGGPLLDLNGKAVGLNIARAGRVSSYALPSSVIRRVADQLQARFASGRARR